ncbi:hypothetical protein P3L10_029049 [Capsicum annuum]
MVRNARHGQGPGSDHDSNILLFRLSTDMFSLRSTYSRHNDTGLQSKLLLENILMDFCCYENKFPFKRGSAHYRELITYWIVEGFLGPFDCFENAYEKGHRVIMVLSHHGFIENQQAGYVKMLDLSSCCCCRIEETVRLGLANVFEGDLGRIAHADGVVRTLGKAEKGKKSSTLLIDRNFLNREVPFDLFQSMREIEALAIFNPTSKPEPLSLDMQNLRLLVLRGCNFLGGIENLLDLRSTVSDKTFIPETLFLKYLVLALH